MKDKIRRYLKTNLSEKNKKKFRILRSNLAGKYYGSPAKKLSLIAVTGTSGKSTTSAMIYHVLNTVGIDVGLISTVGARAGNKELDTGLHTTTPDPVPLQRLLSYMVKRGMKYVVVELSSHALDQGRFGKIEFEHSVFTNIKRDHLDWHGSWEEYAESKAGLINKTSDNGRIFINRDDKEAYDFLTEYNKEHFGKKNIETYSIDELTEVKEEAIGSSFVYKEQFYTLPMIGTYNIENALAAIHVCLELGIDPEQISEALKDFEGLPGRLEIIQSSPTTIIVDFAHNEDSLIRSLKAVKKFVAANRKVINVFGSAGERDVEKRYTMGEASAENADVTIITAEDPRTESLKKINSQIIEGTEKAGGRLVKRFKSRKEYEEYEVDQFSITKKDVFSFDYNGVENRYDAIEFALRIAREGDLVITQGKGHEKSLAFGNTEYPFTDQEAVKKAQEKIQLENTAKENKKDKKK